jgi:hypothetical protein
MIPEMFVALDDSIQIRILCQTVHLVFTFRKLDQILSSGEQGNDSTPVGEDSLHYCTRIQCPRRCVYQIYSRERAVYKIIFI